MYSRTIGDTIRIASHEMTPTVILETPPLEITFVVVVPPNRECRSSALNGNGPTENCYEWPDSSFARLDTLKSNHDILFQHLEHWYPVSGVEVVWHTEYLYSRTWNRVHSVWESAHNDLGRLGTMMEDDGRYWVGLWCLVGYCTGGFGGPAGLAIGRRSMTVPYGPVLAHEIGHNLGLWHPDEDPEVSAQLDALAIGKWSGPCTPVNGGWECVYVPHPIHPNQFTFMHSYFTNRTAADGEGIAPWQLRFLYERLSGRNIPVVQSDRGDRQLRASRYTLSSEGGPAAGFPGAARQLGQLAPIVAARVTRPRTCDEAPSRSAIRVRSRSWRFPSRREVTVRSGRGLAPPV